LTALPQRLPRLSVADLLHALSDGAAGDVITIDEILAALGSQGFGLLVLALALPNAIPGPIIPGFSVPFALGIIVLGVQILQGQPRPLLPRWLGRRRIRRDRFQRFVARVEPVLRRVERWFKPRSGRFMRRGGERPRPVGLILILFAVVLALPIPIANGPEAFAICVLGFGMFEGDEKVQGIGVVIGVLATALNVAVVVAGVQIAHYLVRHFGW
jgi:hypothetical protein